MRQKLLSLFKDSRVVLSVILLLGLALRLVNLGAESYWGDEILSLNIVKHYQGNIAGLINYLREVEIHPPLYYLLLAGWVKLFGFGEAMVRSLSLIFGLATIGVAFLIGKRLFGGAKFGLLAALLVAVLPMQIEFSQEARPYVIYSFVGLACFYLLLEYLNCGRKALIFNFTLLALIGLYLHYSFAFILAPLFALWAAWAVKEKRFSEYRLMLAAASAIFLGFYWWLGAFLYKIALGRFDLLGFKRADNSLRSVYFIEATVSQLIWMVKERMVNRVEIFSMLLFRIALLFAAIKVLFLENDKKLRAPFVGLFLLIMTTLAMFLFSPQSVPYTQLYQRHVLWLSALFAIAFAGIIGNLKTKHGTALAVIFILSLLPFNVRIMGDDAGFDTNHQYKSAAQYINENFKEGDIVVDNFSFDRSNLNFYLDEKISASGFYPPRIVDWKQDAYASRETLGFWENEAQLRGWPPEQNDIDLKMKQLTGSTEVKRIWLVFGNVADYGAGRWLESHGWRHAITAIDKLFPVDLYVKK